MFLSVIIPYYNEKKIIKESIRKIDNFFHKKFKFEIILVNDSSDNSIEQDLIKQKYTSLKIIHNKKNFGKGYSIRKGIDLSNGEIILISDADLSTPIEQFDKLYNHYLKGNDIVIGSRSTADANIIKKQNIFRISAGRIFNISVFLFTGLNFKDTQCGFKLFNASIIKKIIIHSFINKFCIDVEILYLCKKLNYKTIEVGVEWHNDYNSSVSLLKDSVLMFLDLMKIIIKHSKLNKKNYL